jgi:opacity protein-like surface antigen
MKRFYAFALMLVLFAAPAVASKKPQTVTIPWAVQVGSTQLPAGDYKLAWTGSGSSVQVTLTQNEKPVVTFSAREVDGKNNSGLETHTQGGVTVLDIIHLNSVSLVLEGATQSGQ